MNETFTGKNGVKIPKLIYGTAWKEAATADLVELALSKGFRGIDTACQPRHYKEVLVGQGIQRFYKNGLKRGDLFLQTKFTSVEGQDPNDIPYDPGLPLREQILASFEVSKNNLQTDYIDSLVLHSPMNTWQETLEAWRCLEELAQSDQLRQIGISNCYDYDMFCKLYECAKIKPAVLQNRFYPDSAYDGDLRSFCKDKGIFYQSFWTLKANQHILESQAIRDEMAAQTRTAADIFFRCLTQQEIHPLFGTTSEQHMEEALNIFNFTIDSAICDRIAKSGPY